MPMKLDENEFIARLEQQKLQYQKETVAKEEQKRRDEAAKPPLFFSNRSRKSPKLKWISKRLLAKKKKRKELLRAFLDLELQEMEKKRALEREEREPKRVGTEKHKTKITPEEFEYYLSNLSKNR